MLAVFIQDLLSKGQFCFSFKDVQKLKDSSSVALKAALRRLQKKGDIAMPYRGFYVIVPPEYRAAGCLPPEQFIPDLMEHVGEVYYAGLLSAAEYHGRLISVPRSFRSLWQKAAARFHAERCGWISLSVKTRHKYQRKRSIRRQEN